MSHEASRLFIGKAVRERASRSANLMNSGMSTVPDPFTSSASKRSRSAFSEWTAISRERMS